MQDLTFYFAGAVTGFAVTVAWMAFGNQLVKLIGEVCSRKGGTR